VCTRGDGTTPAGWTSSGCGEALLGRGRRDMCGRDQMPLGSGLAALNRDMGIEEVLTAPRSLQNPFADNGGPIRREWPGPRYRGA